MRSKSGVTHSEWVKSSERSGVRVFRQPNGRRRELIPDDVIFRIAEPALDPNTDLWWAAIIEIDPDYKQCIGQYVQMNYTKAVLTPLVRPAVSRFAGVNLNLKLTDLDRAQVSQWLRNSRGLKTIRFVYETPPDVNGQPDLIAARWIYGPLIAGAYRLGIRPVVVLNASTFWPILTDDFTSITPAVWGAYCERFSEFVSQLVQMHLAYAPIYQIWEAGDRISRDGLSSANYATLLKHLIPAIRRKQFNAQIVSQSYTPTSLADWDDTSAYIANEVTLNGVAIRLPNMSEADLAPDGHLATAVNKWHSHLNGTGTRLLVTEWSAQPTENPVSLIRAFVSLFQEQGIAAAVYGSLKTDRTDPPDNPFREYANRSAMLLATLTDIASI